MSSPEQIQREIERTRSELSSNVDRLTDKVSPGRVVGRRVDSIKGTAASVRERVMGSADTRGGNGGGGLHGATDSFTSGVGTTANKVGDVAGSAPQAVRRRAQGNPLATGVVAFGVGMLLSSLAPATDAEQRLAEQAEAKARDAAVPLKAVGQDVAQNLKEPVLDSVQHVKAAASDATQETTDRARSAAEDVKQPLQS